MELLRLLKDQREFSLNTFGPIPRLTGVCDHLRKEIIEVKAAPSDITEWADCLLLCFDGAMRAGMSPEELDYYSRLDKEKCRAEFKIIYDGELNSLEDDAIRLSRFVEVPQEWAVMACRIAASASHNNIDWINLAQAAFDKLQINKSRTWPDWRTVDQNLAIEHI